MKEPTIYYKLIRPYAGKRLDEKKIREILNIGDYKEYCRIMEELMLDNLIEPVKSSGSNGMSPPLNKRFRIKKEEVSYDEILPEIRLLHSFFNVEGYLNQPARYIEHKEWIFPLDTWLKENIEQLKTAVSVNERSFQIFHKEKALKYDKGVASVLHFNSRIRELLNYYDTPEPFFTYNIRPYSETGLSSVNILISENKDTWYTLRKIMSPTRYKLFGIPFYILIYGEGKKINRRYSTLTDYDIITMSGFKSKYYYFGDLDYEGIDIFNELTEQNPELDIRLMTPLYRLMLEKSRSVSLPATKDQQTGRDMSSFLSCFEYEEQAFIVNLLHTRRYIPQEILNYGDFDELIVK